MGDKTREILTDSCVNKIFSENKAHFSASDWGEGIKGMLVAYKYAPTDRCILSKTLKLKTPIRDNDCGFRLSPSTAGGGGAGDRDNLTNLDISAVRN